MLKHPLQLRRSALLEFNLEPAQEFEKEDSGYLLNVTPMVQTSTDLREWGVYFRLSIGPNEEGKKAPYNITISMVAEYHWNGPANTWKDVAKVVGVSGCSMIYGHCRELILLLTGRSVHGTFLLPAVSFQDFDPGEPPEGMPAAKSSGPPRRRAAAYSPPAASLPTKLPPKRPRKTKKTR